MIITYNNVRSVNKAENENEWLEGDDCYDDAEHGQSLWIREWAHA